MTKEHCPFVVSVSAFVYIHCSNHISNTNNNYYCYNEVKEAHLYAYSSGQPQEHPYQFWHAEVVTCVEMRSSEICNDKIFRANSL